VTIPVPADVFVPSAFSPNGDGNNDTFKINSKFVQNASIVIFDRWGGIVFEGSVGGIAWDGTDASGSKKVPGGSYTYKINGKSLAGQEFSRAGTITLLR
jgi:gliding motility-associated-like protein